MPPRLVEFLRRRSRWLPGAALLAMAPKCLLCVAAYADLGAAVGLGGPEICGAAETTTKPWAFWLGGLTVVLGVTRNLIGSKPRL